MSCPCPNGNVITYTDPDCNAGCGYNSSSCKQDCLRETGIETWCINYASKICPNDNSIASAVATVTDASTSNAGTLVATVTTIDAPFACIQIDATAAIQGDVFQIEVDTTDANGNVYPYCFKIKIVKKCQ